MSDMSARRFCIGVQGRHLDELTSTNDFLKELSAKREIEHGFYVSTGYQTSGRGQVGNTWFSDSGKNLLISVLIRPDSLPMQRYFYLNMSVCLSILDVLNDLHQGFVIKWPNDIIFDNRKVAGVLIENSISRNQLRQAVVGIGININQTEWPSAFDIPAISLRQVMGREIDPKYVQEQLFFRMNQRYDQLCSHPDTIRDNYHQYLYAYYDEVPAEADGVKGGLKIRSVAGDGTLSALWRGRVRDFQFKQIKFLFP